MQRTRHLLARLAGRWQVVVVEEPVRDDGPPRLAARQHGEHLQVLVPYTPDEQMSVVSGLLAAHFGRRAGPARVAWLGTPRALPLAAALEPACIVYDAARSYDGAPLPLRQRERTAASRADVVLAAGPAGYEAWRRRHPCVHYMPGAVDALHFAPAALDADSADARAASHLQAALPQPRLGLFGVIDERIDLALVARLAAERPAWQFVLAGPVTGHAYADLPRRDNIHWLGAQPYSRLPHLLAGWDLALAPLALGPAAASTCPHEVLEYLAGEKPVVGTAAADLVSLYGHAVEVAADAPQFIDACEHLLRESPAARLQRTQTMLAAVSTQTWERRADEVHAVLQAALARRLRREPRTARALAVAATLASAPGALQA